MKKANKFVLFLIFVFIVLKASASDLPPSVDDPVYAVEERFYTKTTTESIYGTEVTEMYVISDLYYVFTPDDRLLEAVHVLGYEYLVNGETAEEPLYDLLIDLVTINEYDESLFMVDVHGLEELDRRLQTVSNPLLRQTYSQISAAETLKNKLIAEWNNQRAITIFAVENLGEALEFDFQKISGTVFLPFTAQVMAEELEEDGELFYVVYFVEKLHPKANTYMEMIEEFTGLPLPEGVTIVDTELTTVRTTYVDAKALLPILIEEYSLFVSTIEVGGETVEFKKETEKYSYRIPYSQEDAETEDTDL
ncbi:MAG TPA: hypothetical protein PL057_03170 [Bacillota bacterium]|nr:hypothetical protein [Bacillota bacterium]HQD77806.1 hypothetical protein [Bacillota bacterium]